MGQIVKIEASILEKIVAVAERIAQSKEERRVGREEFAHMLNIEPETLDARIREGRYQRPYKISGWAKKFLVIVLRAICRYRHKRIW